MARSKEQIDQLKSLVDQLRSEDLSTDEIQVKVDEQKAVFDAEQTTTVEVTDEIQTTPTEGKTNGAAAKGATATPVTGPAPESTDKKKLIHTSL
jgi:TolA-binding protein